MIPRFRNVDLELVTSNEPNQMISDFGDNAIVLFSGPTEEGYFTAIETSTEHFSEEDAIDQFKSLFERLSSRALLEWSGAIKREFNFGYDVPSDHKRYDLHLPFSVVTVLNDLKASIGITLYNTAEQDAAANP